MCACCKTKLKHSWASQASLRTGEISSFALRRHAVLRMRLIYCPTMQHDKSTFTSKRADVGPKSILHRPCCPPVISLILYSINYAACCCRIDLTKNKRDVLISVGVVTPHWAHALLIKARATSCTTRVSRFTAHCIVFDVCRADATHAKTGERLATQLIVGIILTRLV